MCGIVAILALGDRPVDERALAAATRTLRHRGPDGQTTWLSPDGRVGLGHALLNIVSPHGRQPIASEDGRCHIAVNGQFYGYRPIRRALAARGHHLKTETDSEIALHLYEERGIESLPELRGEFAFVLWDDVQQTLFAVRDRFGIRSLFYARHQDMLYIASEAKALFAAGLPAAWDDRGLLNHTFGCLYPDRSLFADVRQVPPGHYLAVKDGRLTFERYWDLNYPRQRMEPDGADPAAYIPQVRELLTDAVQVRTEAYVPVGYLLSGGVDSSTTLALGARYARSKVTAFTIAFQADPFDESAKARIAAGHVGAQNGGVNHQIISVDDRALADAFPEAAYHAEMVQYNAHGVARFILTREIQRAGYRAVMAGEGADELFLGYGFVRSAVQAAGQGAGWRRWIQRLPRLVAPLGALERRIASVSPLLARGQRLLPLPPQLVDSFGRAVGLLHDVLTAETAASLARNDPYRAFFRRFPWRDQLRGRQTPHQILYLWLRSIFVTYHLAADRIDMGHAVEVRYPFLDHLLFEKLRDIPITIMGYDGVQKYLLRQVARPWLPESISMARKQPFYAPPSTLRPGDQLLTLVQDTLRGSSLLRLPLFDPAAVVGLLDGMGNRPEIEKTMLDPLLLMMTSLCLIGEAYRL